MSASAPAISSLDSSRVRRRDWLIISLVGAAHACSHFFQLVLPTLYLSLAAEFGYDFAQLGLLASIFFLLSSIGQASSGFIVDRVGPAPVLRFGLACFVVSGLLIAGSNGYLMLVAAAVIGGIGNSVFHPVDYSILNHRVSVERLGHGFSTHGLTGNLGWALTPVYMGAFIYLANWRTAAVAASVLVGIVLFMTWLGRDMLAGRNQDQVRGGQGDEATEVSGKADATDLSRQSVGRTLQTLMSQPALWGAFLFFACTSLSLSAIQNYTIPMLGSVYGVDKMLAGSALSGYMVAAAAGMVAGGFVASSTPRSEFIVFFSLVLGAVFFALLASGWLGPVIALIFVALAGFCSGVSGPSRDMLIRRVTPKGATGTVYGLVYSGMDIGASLAPLGFGIMLDAGLQRGPWMGAAAGFVAAALLAVAVGRAAAARGK
ncbi:MAG TPA: MFS transporter [Burkholderiaceae bacterium]|nr:MFS transporter [Burkholderiaceae bacterium]